MITPRGREADGISVGVDPPSASNPASSIEGAADASGVDGCLAWTALEETLRALGRARGITEAHDGRVKQMALDEGIQATRDLLLSLGSERWELGQPLGGREPDGFLDPPLRSNVHAVLTRLGATWLSLCALWQFEPREFLLEYRRHQRVLEAFRRMRDRPLSPTRPLIGLDIDGVLADYVGTLLGFLNERLGTRYAAEQVTRSGVGRNLDLPPATYRALKREFRDCGLEGLGARPIPGAVRFLWYLRARGYYICLLTGRPTAAFKRLVPDTFEWLARHQIPYDLCVFDPRKADRLGQLGARTRVTAFFEDSAEEAIRIAELGIPVWLRRAPYNGGVSHPRVRYFDVFESLHDLF